MEKRDSLSCEEVRAMIEMRGGAYLPPEVKEHLVHCSQCYQFWEEFEKEKPARLLTMGGWIYGFLVVLSAIWMFFQEEGWKQLQRTFFLVGSITTFGYVVLLGVGVGLVIVFLSQLSYFLFQWSKNLEKQLLQAMGHLSPEQAVLLAFYSSVGEEFFFRGALQNAIGWIPSAILFGCLHIVTFEEGPAWQVLLWPSFAVLMGLLLGWMTLHTGGLLAPILCHFVVNCLNLRFMLRRRKDESSS